MRAPDRFAGGRLLPLRGVKETSQIELAWLVGESRPIVEAFARIASGQTR